MEIPTLIYTILFHLTLVAGAILIGIKLIRGKRDNILHTAKIPSWNASANEFLVFVGVILLSLLAFPFVGALIAKFFYPGVDISKHPIYAIGFYQPLVLLFVLQQKKLLAGINAPKNLRIPDWYSPISRNGFWALSAIAIFCAMLGTIVSNAIPHIIPPLAKYWESNQILVDNLRMLEHKSALFIAIPSIVVITPIVEEIFFRGGLYRYFKEKTGTIPAAIFSSLIFALLHDSAAGIIPLTCLACALCYAYERTGRLIVPIIIHALFNANSLIAIFLGVE